MRRRPWARIYTCVNTNLPGVVGEYKGPLPPRFPQVLEALLLGDSLWVWGRVCGVEVGVFDNWYRIRNCEYTLSLILREIEMCM